MDLHLESCLARERIEEARKIAARARLLEALKPVRRPLRVAAGLALIRLGRSLAAGAPRRVEA
jgi:hypothetical protein